MKKFMLATMVLGLSSLAWAGSETREDSVERLDKAARTIREAMMLMRGTESNASGPAASLAPAASARWDSDSAPW